MKRSLDVVPQKSDRPARGRRVAGLLTTLAVLVVGGIGPAGGSAQANGQDQPPAKSIRLSLDEPRFWDGERVRVSRYDALEPTDLCPFDAGPPGKVWPDPREPEGLCFEYRLILPEPDPAGEHRLRIGIDWGIRNVQYALEVYAPDGTRQLQHRENGCCKSNEIWLSGPLASGEWTVLVMPRDTDSQEANDGFLDQTTRLLLGQEGIEGVVDPVREARFRMRALLEALQPPREGALLPNLRAIPPFDFKFKPYVVPKFIVPLCASSCPRLPDREDYPVTCGPDELVGEGRVPRCIRQSLGVENAGPGTLHLRYNPTSDLLHPAATQLIHREDGGRTVERQAGTMEYHATHSHYHFTGYSLLELYPVIGKNRLRSSPSVRRKLGMCLVPYKIADWRLFYQQHRNSIPTSGCNVGASQGVAPDPTDGQYHMRLASGWGDVYHWDTPGNYVSIPEGDGEYVLRFTTDPDDNVLETREDDNVSYAHIRVEGRGVTLLERGYGTDPWDDLKVVIGEW